MLTQTQYDRIKNDKKMLKNIVEGGSAPYMPLQLYNDIKLQLGQEQADLNCNGCKVNLCIDMYNLILNYEENGSTIR